jgi:hypothetical protein
MTQPTHGKVFFIALLVTCLVIVLGGCSSRLTSDNLSHIKPGMTSKEVKTILGDPTETESQATLSISGTTYVYRSGESEVKVVFLNDKVTAVQSHFK